MKKSNFLIFLSSITLLLFTSCGGNSSEEAVEGICDCFLEAGIEDEYDLMDLDHDEEKAKEVIKCVLPILKDVRDDLDEMNDEERAEYFNDAVKAAVDCECGEKLLGIAAKLYDSNDVEEDFDEIIEDMEWMAGSSYNNYLFGEEEYEYETTEEAVEYVEYYDDGSGYSIVKQAIDGFYFGSLELGISSDYDVTKTMDIYSESSDYITIDRDFDGYSFDLNFSLDNGVLSSVSCNTFYDDDREYQAQMDSEQVLDYLKDLFGYPENDSDKYYDWTYGDMNISFNIFNDGYSMYIDSDYDYSGEYDADCVGDFYTLKIDLENLFLTNIKNGKIKIGETTQSEMKAITGDDYGYDADYDGLSISGSYSFDSGKLSAINLDYFYDCEGTLEYLDIDKESITDLINEKLGITGQKDGDYEDAGIEWTYKGMQIRQANFSDGYGIYIEENY